MLRLCNWKEFSFEMRFLRWVMLCNRKQKILDGPNKTSQSQEGEGILA